MTTYYTYLKYLTVATYLMYNQLMFYIAQTYSHGTGLYEGGGGGGTERNGIMIWSFLL